MTNTVPQAQLRNPLHVPGRPETHWSTCNAGEALPGVATPLGGSLWCDLADQCSRDSTYAVGVFNRQEHRQPPAGADRLLTLFFGRLALRMEWLATIGDRMPGTNGALAVAGLLGQVPSTMTFTPTRRRYPVIAGKLPYSAVVYPRRIRQMAPVVDAWWRDAVPRLQEADLPDAVAVFGVAVQRHRATMSAHGAALFAAITPLVNALTALVERTGVGDVGVLSGTGGAEMKMIADIWRASRGEISASEVVASHGFHGPLEGEISTKVWREDPEPVMAMIDRYASHDASESPHARDQAARANIARMQIQLEAELPMAARPAVRALLRHAARTVPLRGVGKASYLQALDVARAAARRAGEHWARAGQLETPDDVFYLTPAEIARSFPRDVRELIAERRAHRTAYQGMELPSYWQGVPEPVLCSQAPNGDQGFHLGSVVTGVGVGGGIVEGPVRVVTDPSFAEVEPGEVLVAPTTDPSWASIMFVSAGLVVDIGGVLSHAAVVARELGLPCVVNTRLGTQLLRDGDVVRVDGSNGTVELLKRLDR